jgi:hypothetical protein
MLLNPIVQLAPHLQTGLSAAGPTLAAGTWVAAEQPSNVWLQRRRDGKRVQLCEEQGLVQLRSYPYTSGSIQEGSSTAVGACKTSCPMVIPAGLVTVLVHVVSQNYLAIMASDASNPGSPGRLHACQ